MSKFNKNRTVHQAGFEPVVPSVEQPQTQILDRAATGISIHSVYSNLKSYLSHITSQFSFIFPTYIYGVA
jgi:hypothetical protein